jgi:hypothetical protein
LIIIRLFVVCFRDINFSVLNNRLSGTIVALWTAISYDAYNKPKSILYGNGSLTRNIYSPYNNNLTSIEIGRGGDLINNMSYRYDKHNNITSIVNSITNETHNYSYDDMDRITNWQYSNNSYSTQKDYRYDIQNNLTFKTGAGNMTYNTANQLTSRIDNNTLTHTYQYDANGSMDDDFVALIVCGMDNFIAFVDVVGNLVWMSAGACIMVGFLDDAVVVGIIEGFINLSAVRCLGG